MKKVIKDVIRELPYIISISYIGVSTVFTTAAIINKIFG